MISEQLIKTIKRHEGLRLKPYRCTAGKLTIGYGINLEAGIYPEEADFMLSFRLNKLSATLPALLPFMGSLSENRKTVLIDMAYNLGTKGLLEFKNTLALIEDSKFEEASKAMLQSKWAKQVGDRATELSEMMRKG